MDRLRYSVTAWAHADNHELQAAFFSLSLATQWAKQSAALEGPHWDFRVFDHVTNRWVAIVHHDGTVDTPHGIAREA